MKVAKEYDKSSKSIEHDETAAREEATIQIIVTGEVKAAA